jgi:general secretion pathway protein L
MRIDAIVRRWIEILAALYLARRDSRRQLRSLIVTREDQHYVVRHAERGREAMLRDTSAGSASATVPFGTRVPAEIVRSARNSFVILELPAAKVVVRQVSVPVQARKFLSGVVRNQVERLSPWPANGVVHGFSTETAAADAANIKALILMAARTDIDKARQDLAELGLPVDQIVARGAVAEAAEGIAGTVTLWSRLADTSPDGLGSAVRAIGAAIAALATVSLLLGSWALVSTASIRNDSEDVANRARVLQRQIQTGRTATSTASIPPAERAWLLKETSISIAILIEALSRALPASAYVTEIRLEKDNLRIMGLGEDVPALLAPLERSGHMTNVHFFAPTARGPDGKLFRFSIEAHVEPRIKIEED